MLRLVTRIGILAAMLGAAFVLAGSAFAAPTTPQLLTPSSPSVFGSQVTFSWSAATFDNGAFPKWYRLTTLDITPSQPLSLKHYDTLGTSIVVGLSLNHKYLACVRANEVVNLQQSSSTSSCRAFWVVTPINPKDLYYEAIRWPDPPECFCPFWDLHFQIEPDPRVSETIRASRGYDVVPVSGVTIYKDGQAALVYGR
jgi:hypothetical protein